jgi:hypothetical protein
MDHVEKSEERPTKLRKIHHADNLEESSEIPNAADPTTLTDNTSQPDPPPEEENEAADLTDGLVENGSIKGSPVAENPISKS